MIGVLFVLACWAIFFLSPHNVSMLSLDKDAIMAGEWWRLWTSQMAHFKISQLIMNSAIILLMGFIVERFAKVYQVLLALLVTMPLMTALMVLLISDLSDYRGTYGVVAMLTMMAVWFLILETSRFSRGYWAGVTLFLLFVAKVGAETLSLFSSSAGYQMGAMRVDWLMQCAGILIGLVVFNALHQIHTTSAHNQKQKQRRVAGTAAMAAAAAQRRKVRK